MASRFQSQVWFKDEKAVIAELERVEELSNESSESSCTNTEKSYESGVSGSENFMPGTNRMLVGEK